MNKLLCAISASLACLTLQGYDRVSVNLDFVSDLAKQKAEAAYGEDAEPLPPALRNLTYDDYRNLRFRNSEALWLGQDYRYIIEFFHPGYIYDQPVLVFETTDTHVQEIPFQRGFFNYEDTTLSPNEAPDNIGFAGVRIRYPLNMPQVRDDLIVFQGASYFRALGKGNSYGLSSRALGVGIGKEGEQFPHFTRIWLKKPADPNAEKLIVFALLEGENVTGAYEFTLTPGDETVVEVRSRIWPLGDTDRLNFAPLTSMFCFGESSEFPIDDWRPEVHDSDGLLIANGKQWTWRPLKNPTTITHQSFPVDQLRGFGLLQRDRRFGSYEDLEANYENRPSVWVTPEGKWPQGEIVLVELPTPDETEDNINAFWKPAEPPANGQFYDLNYRMSWRSSEPNRALANVLESRIGQKTLDPQSTSFAIEFSPPKDFKPEQLSELTIDFQADGAPVKTEPQLRYNKPENSVRAYFDLSRNTQTAHHLALTLMRNGEPVSEKWTYLWQPIKANEHVASNQRNRLSADQ
ncbi:glucan biosynthesis protein [Cerasicoccus fimbriatus]|uniref:glucan biosynthesis protein n=1 Tax=Cerasicoccus fimbriatus TaxID=3014554 RepID=UPI0022B4F330|nr:glucan biosynthesis protein G [Cerasicoccus sp. TK19100]